MLLRSLTNPTLKSGGLYFLAYAPHQACCQVSIVNQPIFLDKSTHQHLLRLDKPQYPQWIKKTRQQQRDLLYILARSRQ